MRGGSRRPIFPWVTRFFSRGSAFGLETRSGRIRLPDIALPVLQESAAPDSDVHLVGARTGVRDQLLQPRQRLFGQQVLRRQVDRQERVRVMRRSRGRDQRKDRREVALTVELALHGVG